MVDVTCGTIFLLVVEVTEAVVEISVGRRVKKTHDGGVAINT
jgi:hypothetical protein